MRPGHTKVYSTSGSSGLTVTASKDPDTDKAVLVVINDSNDSITWRIDGFTSDIVGVYRTSANENIVYLGEQEIDREKFHYTFAPQSVTTIVEK